MVPDSDFFAFGGRKDVPAAGLPALVRATDVGDACAVVAGCNDKLDLSEDVGRRVLSTCAFANAGDQIARQEAPTLPKAAQLEVATAADLSAARGAMCSDKTPPKGVGAMKLESGGGFGALGGSAARLIGATDFLVARAEEEVAAWSVDRFLAQACDGSGLGTVVRPVAILPATCAWVERVDRGSAGGILTLAVPAVLDDAQALIRHVAEEVLRADGRGKLKEALTPGEIDVLVGTAVLGRVAECVMEGDSLTGALAAWSTYEKATRPKWTCKQHKCDASERVVEPERLSWAQTPVSSALYTASVVAAALPDTRLEITSANPPQLFFVRDQLPAKGDLAVAILTNLRGREGMGPDGVAIAPFGVDELRLAVGTARDLVGAWDAARGTQRYAEQVRLGLASSTRNTTTYQAALLCSDAAGDMLRTVLTASERVMKLGGGNTDGIAFARDLAADVDGFLHALVTGDAGAASASALAVASDILERVVNDATAAQALGVLSRAASFSTALTTAKDPASAREAIENVASPPGGYAHKRRGPKPVYATLNGYVGGGVGREYLVLGDAYDADNWATAAWPTIAVGPEIGLRMAPGSRYPWSLGVQAQLLDLGTLAVWRIGAQDAEELPAVDLGHVFAPGVNLVAGLPGAPFSIVGSAVFAPSLRKVDEDLGLDVAKATSIRGGIGIAVDIPVIH